jgi:hypothetical protein
MTEVFDAEGRVRELITAHLHVAADGPDEDNVIIAARIQDDLIRAVHGSRELTEELVAEVTGTLIGAFVFLTEELGRDPVSVWQGMCEARAQDAS